MLLLLLDLAGTFVFGLSGALLAARKQLDAFGLAVLAVSAALGGGAVRDVLLAAGPPVAVTDARYLLSALLAAAVGFFSAHQIQRAGGTVRVFDAAGLGLFAVAGTAKALAAGVPAVSAVALGVLTAVGGGVLRDLLVGEVPLVLRREIYAVAALLGAVIVAVADRLGLYGPVAATAAAVITFVVRLLAVRFDVHAPRPVAPPD